VIFFNSTFISCASRCLTDEGGYILIVASLSRINRCSLENRKSGFCCLLDFDAEDFEGGKCWTIGSFGVGTDVLWSSSPDATLC
jgi:hypothetical protein